MNDYYTSKRLSRCFRYNVGLSAPLVAVAMSLIWSAVTFLHAQEQQERDLVPGVTGGSDVDPQEGEETRQAIAIVQEVHGFFVRLEKAQKQWYAVQAIRERDGFVVYDYKFDTDAEYVQNGRPPGPRWVRCALGVDFCSNVVEAFVCGDDLVTLKALPCLKRLNVKCTTLDEDGLVHLKGLVNLEYLGLCGTAVRGPGLAHVRPLTKLKTLDLCETRLDDAGLKHLPKLAGLEVLHLDETAVRGPGLKHLARLTSLKYLGLDDTDVDDAGLKYLKEVSSLEELSLCRTRVQGPGLAHLAKLPQFRKLWLSGPSITDRTLPHLRNLNRLEKLVIARETAVTGAGLVHLKPLTSLRHLKLPYIQSIDSGLQHVGTLTNLRHLDLYNTGVTDIGLRHVQGLSKLEFLCLSSGFVGGCTTKGVQTLQNILPDCEVSSCSTGGISWRR